MGNIPTDSNLTAAVTSAGNNLDTALDTAITLANTGGSTANSGSGPMLAATLVLQKDTNAFQEVSELAKGANKVAETVAQQMRG